MLISGWASTAHINSKGFAVAPHAFADFIASEPLENIPLLLSHEPNRPAGRIISLETRRNGLWIEAELDPALPGVKLRMQQIAAKKPYGFSVGIGECKAYAKPCGTPFIYRATLREVSLTDSPSNPACSMQHFSVTHQASKLKLWPAEFEQLFAEQAAVAAKARPLNLPPIRYEEPA